MTNLLGSLLVNAIVPRWKQYALGATLLLGLASAGLLLAAQPGLTDTTPCTGWRTPVCLPLRHGIAGRWILGIGLTALVVGVASTAHAAADPLLAVMTAASWPDWKPIRAWAEHRRKEHHKTWEKLEHKWPDSSGTVTGSTAAVRAYERWRCYPTGRLEGIDEPRTAPTLLGNIIAACQQRVLDRHGLDLGVCWGLLTITFPESAQTQLAEAANALRLRVQHLAVASLTLLLPVITVTAAWHVARRLTVTLIALAVCGTLVAIAWGKLRSAVVEYVELVEQLVLVHRGTLYTAAGFGLPDTTTAERELAQRLRAVLTESTTNNLPLVWENDRQ